MNHKVELMSLNLYVDNFYETIEFFIERAFHIVELSKWHNNRFAKMKNSGNGQFSITISSGDMDYYTGRVTLLVEETFSNGMKVESQIDLHTRQLLNYGSESYETANIDEMHKQDATKSMEEANG